MDKLQLVIQFDSETGAVQVSGPINNRMLSYGMLKLAEKAIDENHERSKTPQIQPARAIPLHLNGRG